MTTKSLPAPYPSTPPDPSHVVTAVSSCQSPVAPRSNERITVQEGKWRSEVSRCAPFLPVCIFDELLWAKYLMGTERPKCPVTFWCEHGSHEATENRAPGPMPRYCAEHYGEAQRALNALRVKAHYRRQKGPRTGHERPRGRPRKEGADSQ